MAAYSSYDAPVDDIHRQSILSRHAPPAALDWYRKYGLDEAEGPVRVPGDTRHGILARLCVPIRHRGHLCGYLWLIDDDVTLTDAQLRVATKTAEIAGPLMFDDLLVERIDGTALTGLLSPSDLRRAEGVRYFDGAGHLAPPGNVVVVVVQPAASMSTTSAVIAESLRDITRRRPPGHIIGRANTDHGVLVTRCWPDNAVGRALAAEVRHDLLRRLRRTEADVRDASVVAGVGEPVGDLDKAYRSYRQARLAAQVAVRVPSAGQVAQWSDLGVFRTLASLSDGEDALSAIDPRLVRLLGTADTALITTLETFLDLAGDVKATADQLHLHRGTVYYRLQRAADAAGVDLHSGQDRLALHLGLKLAHLAGLLSTC